MTTKSNKDSVFCSDPIYRKNRKTETSFWPPRVVWAREMGWLNVRDPEDGTWFSIPAKEAPTGYPRLAQRAKQGLD